MLKVSMQDKKFNGDKFYLSLNQLIKNLYNAILAQNA